MNEVARQLRAVAKGSERPVRTEFFTQAADEIDRLQADLDAIKQTLAGVKSMHADALEKNGRLQAIVDGAEAASRGDYVVEYGWNSDESKMGYWWGTRGSFASDRLTWAGTSRTDAWYIIGVKAAKRTRAT